MDLVNAQKIYSGIIMGCNCATDKAIKELYAKYGENRRASVPDKFSHKVKYYTRNILAGICMIPISVYLFLFVFYKAIVENETEISISKFFGLK